MSETKTVKWDEARVEQLMSIVGTNTPVSVATIESAAVALGVTTRSIASKLRNLDIECVSLAKVQTSAFTDAETSALTSFVTGNKGVYTYKEIAENFADGKFSAKQVQGKILSLELTEDVKASEKVEVARTYNPAEEEKFAALVKAGAFIEDIATALNKSVQSVRGKALSMLRQEVISKIPTQKESHAKDSTDAIEALGDKIATMTVAEVALATGKTERGIKTTATRRGLVLADYDGQAKKAKAEAKVAV